MKRFLPLLAALLCSCAPYNTHVSDLQVGMSKGDVTKLLGRPVSAEAESGTEVLYYRLASSFLDSDGSDTREYWVRLQGGSVTGYGERNDQAAMDRSRRQYQAAWGVVGAIQHTQDNITQQNAVNAYRERTYTPQRVNVNVQGNIRHDVNGTLYLR